MRKQLFNDCPRCGGELVEKEVEKLLRGGEDVAVLRVSAQVCLYCGERLYDEATVLRFETIRTKLRDHQTAEFVPIGQVLKAA